MKEELKKLSKQLLDVYSVPSGHKIDNVINRRHFLKAVAMSAVGAASLAYVDSYIPEFVQAYRRDTAIAQVLKYPVTIDGAWTTPEEWNDEEIEQPGDEGDRAYPMEVWPREKSSKGICKLKYDPKDSLYFLAENLTDEKITGISPKWDMGDNFHISLTKEDKSYMFRIEWENTKAPVFYAWEGVPGKGWKVNKKLIDIAGFSGMGYLGTSMYSETPHMIYEAKLNMNFFKDVAPDSEGKIKLPTGLSVYNSGSDTWVNWPWDAFNINIPATWGYLEFDPTAISEFPILQCGSVAGISVVSAILAKKLVARDKMSRRQFLSGKHV